MQTSENLDQPRFNTNNIGKSNKFFPVLLVLITLVLTAAGFYNLGSRNSKKMNKSSNYETQFVTATPQTLPVVSEKPTIIVTDPISMDWTSYINSSLNFSLKYPSDDLIICNSDNQKRLLLWSAPFNCYPTGYDIPYEIGVVVVQKNEYKQYKQPASSETITVDAKPATKNTYIYTVEDGPLYESRKSTEILIPLKNNLIQITLFGEDQAKILRFNQIVSTIKFAE